MGKKDVKVPQGGQPINIFRRMRYLKSENDLIKLSIAKSPSSSANGDSIHQIKLEESTSSNELPSINDVNEQLDDSTPKSTSPDKNILNSLRQPLTTKKRHNIPICEVKVDEDYNNRIPPDFPITSTYISQTKRIDDENDPILDYWLEDDDVEWMGSLLSSMKSDPEFLNFYKSPASPVMEMIINLLERNTGNNREPIPLALAQKLVCTKTDLSPNLALKLVPPLYSYWIRKRDRLQKGLSRKFWPQTQSNDTNPHHVFRARDKERYRLRKQHRRNDVESFRKMQHLRREFEKSQFLLLYVLEREYLNQASFDIEQEIFEQRLYDLNSNLVLSLPDEKRSQPTIFPPTSSSSTVTDTLPVESNTNQNSQISASSSSSNLVNQMNPIEQQPINDSSTSSLSLELASGVKRRREIPYRYNIQCKELVLSSEDINSIDLYGQLTVAPLPTKKDSSTGRLSNTIKLEKGYKDRLSFDSLASSARRNSIKGANLGPGLDSESAIGSIDDSYSQLASVSVEIKPKKRRSLSTFAGRSRVPIVGDTDNPWTRVHGVLVDNSNNLQPSAANIVNIAEYHSDVTSLRVSDITSSLGRLNQWATKQISTFLHPFETRDKIYSSSLSCPSNYMKDLEFRQDQGSTAILPIKYRCRGRIGRGGRLVVDRVPIYDTPDDSSILIDKPTNALSSSYAPSDSSVSSHYMSSHHQYIQPTCLPVSARFTTSAMLQGHGQNPKRNVHRNITSNSINIDGNLFYTATAANNASINTATGVTANAYGYASTMPVALPISVPTSANGNNNNFVTSSVPAQDMSQTSSSSSQPSTSQVPHQSPTANSLQNSVNNPATQLHFCLPPSFPSSLHGYLPLGFLSREKEILLANYNQTNQQESEVAVEVNELGRLHHLSPATINAYNELNSAVIANNTSLSPPAGTQASQTVFNHSKDRKVVHRIVV